MSREKIGNRIGEPQSPRIGGPAAPPRDAGRRSFLAWLGVGLGGVVVAELAWLLASFLRPRKVASAKGEAEVLVAGPVDRFESGTVTAFPQGKFYLARLADGGFLALARECTHLGCTVTWEPAQSRFLCPCHASAFDLQGDVLSPPAPRSLDLYAVSIENREVKVDLAQRSRRDRFEPSQTVYV